jgi:hypothetical protein
MEAVSLCSIGKAQRALGNSGLAIRRLEQSLKLGEIGEIGATLFILTLSIVLIS